MKILPTSTLTDAERAILQAAEAVLVSRLRTPGELIVRPDALARLMRVRMGAEDREVVDAVYLDAEGCVIEVERIAYGERDECDFSIPQLCRRALLLNASSVAIGHVHPGTQNPEPSTSDIAATRELHAALRALDMRLMDHVIVTATRHVSLVARGVLV